MTLARKGGKTGGDVVAIVQFKEDAFPYSIKKNDSFIAERINRSGRSTLNVARELVGQSEDRLLTVWNHAIVGFAAIVSEKEIHRFANHPDVEAVTIDEPGEWLYSRAENTLLGRGNADEDKVAQTEGGTWIYRYPYRGSGVTAYVLDSGIRATHVEFSGAISATFNGVNPGQPLPADTFGHGTKVAGLLGGRNHGAAPRVNLVPILVGTSAPTQQAVINALDWIIINYNSQPAVANMSFTLGYSPSVNASIQNLISSGIVVTVAAGNDGGVVSANSTPQGVGNAIIVGATTIVPSGGLHERYATYSAHGSRVDILALGTQANLASSSSDTALVMDTGTSFAAPHVAGAAAILLEQNPSRTPAQILSILKSSGRPRVQNVPPNTTNKSLVVTNWWYPFNTLAEWTNSNTPLSADYWFHRPQFGWVWASTSYYPWFYRDADDTWIRLISEDGWLTFQTGCNCPGHGIEAYWP